MRVYAITQSYDQVYFACQFKALLRHLIENFFLLLTVRKQSFSKSLLYFF